LARQLWMRVNIAAAGSDLDAIEAIGRFAQKAQPAEFSPQTVTDKSGVRSEPPIPPKLPWKLIALGILPVIAFLVVILNFFPLKSPSPPPAVSPTPTSPTPSQPTAQPGIQTVQVKSKNAWQHGFFTRNGYIITAKPAIGDAREVTVIWQRDNEKQQGQARVEKSGTYDPQVILLKLTGTNIPQQVLPIRISSSLQVGDRVERYLAPYDRTPGKVLKLGATQEIWVSSSSKSTIHNALITTSILGPGDTGAPVVDTEGRVVAMGYGGNQTQTISIPIEDIKINFPEAF
jgi:S1-C subfamily serine protease